MQRSGPGAWRLSHGAEGAGEKQEKNHKAFHREQLGREIGPAGKIIGRIAGARCSTMVGAPATSVRIEVTAVGDAAASGGVAAASRLGRKGASIRVCRVRWLQSVA